MVSKISQGIQVSVEIFYQPDYSNPVAGEFTFAYRITIENHNNFDVQLLRRQWYIFDSNGENREVEGQGIVGLTPIINPTEQFVYTSGCNLKTEMGKMHGYYTMFNLHSKKTFKVNIPFFEMIAPTKLN